MAYETSSRRRAAVLFLCALVAGCAGPPVPPGLPAERIANVTGLMRLDGNGDGALERTELDAGLRREYAAIDADRNGSLSITEATAENSRRWRSEGPAATPLIDWNQDGNVDFLEFANATRGLFASIDRDANGALSREELVVARSVPQGPRPPGAPGGPPRTQ
jgi:hypothetical protein